MKLPASLPTPAPLHNSKNSLQGGLEIVLTLVLFVLVGLALDSWLGTAPWFTIGLAMFGAVGSGVRLYYTYTHEMEQLEADRVRSRRAGAA